MLISQIGLVGANMHQSSGTSAAVGPRSGATRGPLGPRRSRVAATPFGAQRRLLASEASNQNAQREKWRMKRAVKAEFMVGLLGASPYNSKSMIAK